MERPSAARIQSPLVVAELVRHGAHEAARALALLLRCASVPVASVESVTHAELAARYLVDGQTRALVVAFTVAGGFPGQFAVAASEADARVFAAELVGRFRSEKFSKRALGALTELANIAASAYFNGVARAIDTACVPSVPILVLDDAESAVDSALGSSSEIAVVRLQVGGAALDLALAR